MNNSTDLTETRTDLPKTDLSGLGLPKGKLPETKMDKRKQTLAGVVRLTPMLFMAVVLGLGEKIGEKFLPVYILAIGGSAYAVGFLNTIDNFLSAVYSYIGGVLSDKFGYKKSLVIFTLIAMLGYIIIILVPTWWAVLVGAVFFISWSALSQPAITSFISKSLKLDKQALGIALHSLTRRLPVAIGPLLGGIFITIFGIEKGARISFICALALSVFALLFIIFKIKNIPPEPFRKISLLKAARELNKPQIVLLLSDICAKIAGQLPYVFVVVFVMEVHGATAMQYSVLNLIETITAFCIYIPVVLLQEKIGSRWCIAITFMFYAIFPTLLLFSNTMAAFSIAFFVRGLKEFGEPVRKALILKLSPEDKKGTVFGVYYLLRDSVVSVFTLLSAVLWKVSPNLLFIVAAVFGVLALLIFTIFGRKYKDEYSLKE